MTEAMMICGDVDERLPDYLDDTLDEATRRRVKQHVASCERCASLIAELEEIQTSAAALPQLKPSRDLWAGIAARIETPVIALGSADVPFRSRTPRWLIGAIAAGLVFATAGITHVLTRQSMERELAARSPVQTGSMQTAAVQPAVATPQNSDTMMVPEAPAPKSRSVGARYSAGERPAVQAPAPTPRASMQLVGRAGADATYNREIERLRAVLRQRRAQLDPETVRVIEQSLRVIDEAIAQSREALAKDPASAFLRDQLDSSLEKKVDLLRTAALLPART